MSSLPPLSITVSAKRRACVLDIDLALSPFGLLLAQRLSEEFNLWIALDLWRILDNPECYFANPDQMLSDLTCINTEETKNVLAQWCLARLETDLAGAKVFWIGDAMRESLLPSDADQNLPYRFETLARALAPKDEGLSSNDYETAALCAALMPYRGFILTLHIPDNTNNTPAICAYLWEKCGIPFKPVESGETVHMEREWLMPILARAGIMEMMWAGLNLAAVHLFVPNAVFVPPPEREEELTWEFPPMTHVRLEETPRKEWWVGAQCFWYPINFSRFA